MLLLAVVYNLALLMFMLSFVTWCIILLVTFLSRPQHVKLFYVPFLKASPFHNFSLLLKSHIIIIQNSINDKNIYSLFIALVWCSLMMDSFGFEDMTLSIP